MKTSYGLKLLPYLRPYRLRFLWALAQVFLIAAFELLKPWPLQVVIDNVLSGKAVGFAPLEGWSPLALLGLACLGIIVVQFIAGALGRRIPTPGSLEFFGASISRESGSQ